MKIMSTRTLKRTARLLTNANGKVYRENLQAISEAVDNIGILRVRYNENLKSWEILTDESDMLIYMLSMKEEG